MCDTDYESRSDYVSFEAEIRDTDLGNLKSYDLDPESYCESEDCDSNDRIDDEFHDINDIKIRNTNWFKFNP